MKIVVLDGYAANPGDLNWDELRTLGECEIYDRTAPDEVLERSKDAEAILTNKVGDHGRTHGILAQPEVYWRNSHPDITSSMLPQPKSVALP